MSAPLYQRLLARGTFVAVIPPRLEFSSGQSWRVAVPRAVERKVGRTLREAALAVHQVFLPGSLGGLRFLPQALASELDGKINLWIRAYLEVRQLIEERDPGVLEMTIAERFNNLSDTRRKSNRPSCFSAGQIEMQLKDLAEQDFPAEPPSLCPMRLSSSQMPGLGKGGRCSLSSATHSFVSASHGEIIYLVSAALRKMVFWECVFKHCTNKVYASRGYYRKHLGGPLHLERWATWLETLEDDAAEVVLRKLAGSMPRRDPGCKKALTLCRRIIAQVKCLDGLASDGLLVPGILRSADAVL